MTSLTFRMSILRIVLGLLCLHGAAAMAAGKTALVGGRLIDGFGAWPIADGPLYWTPTVEGLFQYESTVDNPEKLEGDC